MLDNIRPYKIIKKLKKKTRQKVWVGLLILHIFINSTQTEKISVKD